MLRTWQGFAARNWRGLLLSRKLHCTIINDFDERYVRSYMEEGQALAGCHCLLSWRDNPTPCRTGIRRDGPLTDIAMELAGGW